MTEMQLMAEALGISDRTLRRGIATRLVRAHKLGPKKRYFVKGEPEWLLANWSQIAELRQALKRVPSISLAVLTGTAADRPVERDEPLDLLISSPPRPALGEAWRLSQALSRDVRVQRLEHSVVHDRDRLLAALNRGRPLRDRYHELQYVAPLRRVIRMEQLGRPGRQPRDARAAGTAGRATAGTGTSQ